MAVRVQWTAEGPFTAGDLLVRNLADGEEVPEGWTPVRPVPETGDRVAWRVATGDERDRRGAFVISGLPDPAAGTAASAAPAPARGYAYAADPDLPVVETHAATAFPCPHCGAEGHRVAGGRGVIRFTPPPDHVHAASHPGGEVGGSYLPAEATLICLADRAVGPRRWRLLLLEPE